MACIAADTMADPEDVCVCDSITDPPNVSLAMGRSLNAEGIKAGDDVYFDCHVDARPPASRIEWRRDVRQTQRHIVPYSHLYCTFDCFIGLQTSAQHFGQCYHHQPEFGFAERRAIDGRQHFVSRVQRGRSSGESSHPPGHQM